MCAAGCRCCRGRRDNLGRSGRAVHNRAFTMKFSPTLSFDSARKFWERAMRWPGHPCSRIEQSVVFPLKTRTCVGLTRKHLSYSQRYPAFVGRNTSYRARASPQRVVLGTFQVSACIRLRFFTLRSAGSGATAEATVAMHERAERCADGRMVHATPCAPCPAVQETKFWRNFSRSLSLISLI